MKKGEERKEGKAVEIDRRAFLYGLGGAAGITIVAGEGGQNASVFANHAAPENIALSNSRQARRAELAYQVRLQAARRQKQTPYPRQQDNGDETLYPNKIATFTKGLVHNLRGEVDLASYRSFKVALSRGRFTDFETIPMGNAKKLVNPQAAYSFVLEGKDSSQYALPPAPAFSSHELASEMIELYWMSLCRDVPFDSYEQNGLTESAVAELSPLTSFTGPRIAGKVTPQTLFRGLKPENPNNPYISQFLWKSIPMGANVLEQKINTSAPNLNYLHTFEQWLAIQRGAASGSNPLGGMTRYELDRTPRYIRNARDLSEYVHRDQSYIPFMNACLSLLGMGAAVDLGHPYRRSRTQAGFSTFGEPHILDMLARVANYALKVAWYQKWLVHLLLRPEAFGGRVHLVRTAKADYPVSQMVLNSKVLDAVYSQTGSYLLIQAYPEGSPLHPSYPSGHSVIAGACATVLKAYFDEMTYVHKPVVASRDGLTLEPYRGEALSVGEELNKLADNIGMGRIMAGIHWRSDHLSGLLLGEAVAIELMKDMKDCFTETHGVFSLTKFDGTVITI